MLNGASPPVYNLYKITKFESNSQLEEETKDVGIYIVSIGWGAKYGYGGHATIVQRTKDGKLIYIEPQHDNSSDRSVGSLKGMRAKTRLHTWRVAR